MVNVDVIVIVFVFILCNPCFNFASHGINRIRRRLLLLSVFSSLLSFAKHYYI